MNAEYESLGSRADEPALRALRVAANVNRCSSITTAWNAWSW
jgi:hypothetical protein